MANLLGQDIGLNYKGIITIGSTINQNISASLQRLTDGDGNNLPIQVSTTQVSIGGSSSLGRLVVKGDGTNPIFRAEDSLGTSAFLLNAAGDTLTVKTGFNILGNDLFVNVGASKWQVATGSGFSLSNSTPAYENTAVLGVKTVGTIDAFRLSNSTGTFFTGTLAGNIVVGSPASYSSGTNTKDIFSAVYTINTTGGTNTITGIKVNATETSITGTTHNLMDLQVGGVSQFRVDKTGFVNTRTFSFGFGPNNYFSISSGANFLFLVDSVKTIYGQGELRNVGSAYIGNTSTSPSARLHVRGDGTNPIIRFEDSAGSQYVTLNSTGTTIAMGVAANNQASLIHGGGQLQIVANTLNTYRISLVAQEYIYFNAGGFVFPSNSTLQSYGAFGFSTIGGSQHITTGTFNKLLLNEAFNPSSGTGIYNSINISNTINQTGGANGITRGIFINPTLTSAADYRAIGVQAGTTSAHKLIRLANAAGNKVFEVTAAQEIGLFGVSPSAQPTTAIAQASVTPGGGSPILEDDLFAGYTVAQIAQALINLGILKP